MNSTEIKRLLKQVVGADSNYPVVGTVMSIEGETCTVKLYTDLEISDVRLKVTVSTRETKVLVIPKIGTEVLMISGSGSLDNLYVILCDEVAKIEILSDDIQIIIDEHVTVQNKEVNLATMINDLCELLKTFQVTTPNGPSGAVLSTTLTKINKVQNEFKKLLK